MPDAGPTASATPVAAAAEHGIVQPVPAAKPAEGPGDTIQESRGPEAVRDPDGQTALSQLIQGGVLLGVMVLLFVLAGFRG